MNNIQQIPNFIDVKTHTVLHCNISEFQVHLTMNGIL